MRTMSIRTISIAAKLGCRTASRPSVSRRSHVVGSADIRMLRSFQSVSIVAAGAPAARGSRLILLRQKDAAGFPEVRGLGTEMTETRVIMACAERQVHWYPGAEPARCTDPGHQHRQAEVHRHRSVVTLPGGIKITAVSFD